MIHFSLIYLNESACIFNYIILICNTQSSNIQLKMQPGYLPYCRLASLQRVLFNNFVLWVKHTCSINIPGGRKTKSRKMRMLLHFLAQIIVTLQPLFQHSFLRTPNSLHFSPSPTAVLFPSRTCYVEYNKIVWIFYSSE